MTERQKSIFAAVAQLRVNAVGLSRESNRSPEYLSPATMHELAEESIKIIDKLLQPYLVKEIKG